MPFLRHLFAKEPPPDTAFLDHYTKGQDVFDKEIENARKRHIDASADLVVSTEKQKNEAALVREVITGVLHRAGIGDNT